MKKLLSLIFGILFIFNGEISAQTCSLSANVNSSGVICAGSAVTLTAVSDIAASVTYTWTGATSTTNTASFTAPNNTSSAVYSVIISDGTIGCTASVSVNYLKVDATINGSNNFTTTICPATTTTLAASGASSYQWSGASSSTSSFLSSAGLGSYTVVATQQGCTGTATANVSATMTTPPTISPSSATLCAGATQTFMIGTGFTDIVWSSPGAAGVPNALGTEYTVTVGSVNSVTVSVTAKSNGCPVNTSKSVTVNPTPTASFTFTGGGCSDAILTSSLSSGNQWIKDGVNISGANGSTYTATTSGSYSLKLTAGSCSSTSSQATQINVTTFPNNMSATVSSTSVCEGGSVMLNITNLPLSGSPTYTWSGSGIGSTNTNLVNPTVLPVGSGKYNVAVTIGNCSKLLETSNVIFNTKPIISAISQSPNLCSFKTLTAFTTPSNGLSYAWTNATASTANTATLLPPGGTVKLKVTNSSTLCVSDEFTTSNITVNSSNITNLNFVINKPKTSYCLGETIDLQATFGGIATGYEWKGISGSTTAPITNGATNTNVSSSPTQPGTYIYSISVTDGNCLESKSISVTVNSQPTASIIEIASSCANKTFQASGGTNYSWTASSGGNISGATNTATIVASGNGTYTVNVSNGTCSSNANISIQTLTNPFAGSTISVLANPTTICENETVSLSVSGFPTVVNGWAWTGSSSVAFGNSATTTAKPTQSGKYTVTLSTSSGCAQSFETTNQVTVNLKPTVGIQPKLPTVCGQETLEANGGATYQWSSGSGGVIASTILNAPTITVTSNATYTVIATSSAGCKSEKSYIVSSINTPFAGFNPIITTATPTICAGSAIQLAVTGTPSGSTFKWSGTNLTTNNTFNSPTNTANPTSPSTYTYTVDITKDNCTVSRNTSITVNATPVINSIKDDPSGCNRKLSVDLGNSSILGFIYNWAGPNSISGSNSSIVASVTGDYFVTVSNGACIGTKTKNVTVNGLTTALFPVPTNNGNQYKICEGETVSLVASADPGATITWLNATPDPTDSKKATFNGTTNTVVTMKASKTINNVICEDEKMLSIIVDKKPSFTLPDQNVCSGSSLSISINDNSPALSTYNWTGPSNFSSTQKNPFPISNITNSNQGTYNLAVTNGVCKVFGNKTITVIQTPTVSNPNANNSKSICEGDEVILNMTVSNANQYNWSGPNGYNSISQNPVIQNTTIQANAGTYKITATNSNNTGLSCSATGDFPLIIKQLPIFVTSTPQNICASNSKILKASAQTLSSITWFDPNNPSANISTGDTYNFSNNTSGAYNFKVKANGCESATILTVNVSDKAKLTEPTVSTISLCEDKLLSIKASGTGSTVYEWKKGGVVLNNTKSFLEINTTQLSDAGQYTVTLGSPGCSDSKDVNVTVNNKPGLADLPANIPICETNTIKLEATTAYLSTYKWTGPNLNSATNPTNISNANAGMSGVYTVSAISSNGCAESKSTAVFVGPKPNINFSNKNVVYCEGTDVTFSVEGTSAFKYNWSGPNGYINSNANASITLKDITEAMAGDYKVTTGTGNCSSEAIITLKVTKSPALTIPNISVCRNSSEIVLTATSTNNIPIKSYEWSGNSSTTNSAKYPTGSVGSSPIILKATGDNGCVGNAKATIEIKELPKLKIIKPTKICEGDDITLTVNSENSIDLNGIATWQPGGISGLNHKISPKLVNETYTVIAEGKNGCSSNEKIEIKGDKKPEKEFKYKKYIGGQEFTDSYSLSSSDLSINICTGQGINLYGDAVNNYIWQLENGTVTTKDAKLKEFTIGGTKTFSVTVTNATSQCSSIKNYDVVVAKDLPVIIQVQNNKPDVICNTDTLTLKATAGQKYVWSFNGTIDPKFTGMQEIKVSTNGIYKVTVTDAAGCKGETSQGKSITKSEFNLSTIKEKNNLDSICSNKQITLDVTNVNGTTPFTYYWNYPTNTGTKKDTTTLNTLIDSPFSNSRTIRKYELTIKDKNGCLNSISKSITVNPIPDKRLTITTPQFGVADNKGKVCEGQALTVTLNNIDIVKSLTWSNSSLPKEKSINYKPSQSEKLFASNIENKYGCILDKTDEADITVVQKPLIQIVSQDKGKGYCVDNLMSIQLSYIANSTGGADKEFWTWTLPDGSNLKNQLDIKIDNIATKKDSGLYTIKVIDKEQCEWNESILIKVNNVPNPVLLSTNNYLPCQGERSIYGVINSGSKDLVVFDWTETINGIVKTHASSYEVIKNGKISNDNNGNSIIITWKPDFSNLIKTGEIKVKGISGNCDKLASNIIKFPNDPSKTAPKTSSIGFAKVNKILYCRDSTAKCYQWGTLNDNGIFVPIVKENFQSYVAGKDFDTKKTYAVLVGCTGECQTLAIYRENDKEEEEVNLPTALTLYPNPNDGRFILKGVALPEEQYTLKIIDVLGREIYQENIKTPKGALYTNMELSNQLSKGIYFLVLDGKVQRYKTIKFVMQ